MDKKQSIAILFLIAVILSATGVAFSDDLAFRLSYLSLLFLAFNGLWLLERGK